MALVGDLEPITDSGPRRLYLLLRLLPELSVRGDRLTRPMRLECQSACSLLHPLVLGLLSCPLPTPRTALTSVAIEDSPLSLEGVDNVHRGDRFPARMLTIRHRVAESVLEKDFQNAARLLVNQT